MTWTHDLEAFWPIMPDLEDGIDRFSQYPISGEPTLEQSIAPPTTKRVEINLNEELILKQIRAAKIPVAAKKMAARILTLCIQKNSGRLWLNMTALKSLRHSPMIRDALDALGKLQKAKVITWKREQRDDAKKGFER